MNKQATGKRNDPCFCGSGKKYKKCCLYQHQGFRYNNDTKTWDNSMLSGKAKSSREMQQQIFGPGTPKMATE